MADLSVVGAKQALMEQLQSRFPSVPFETIRSIATQHSSDPTKCWDLVRLEASQPTSANGAFGDNRERFFAVTGPVMRPSGSYVIRRPGGSPSPQGGFERDTRSCTPPRGRPSCAQPGLIARAAAFLPISRPQTLPLDSTSQRSPSPVGQRQRAASSVSDEGVHSYPGTPTGVVPQGPKRSVGYMGIPSLKINYSGPSQITLSSATPASPTLIVSSQPSLRPVLYQFPRRTSQCPSAAGAGEATTWQYDRRPSFADVELAQNASRQRSASSSSAMYQEPLRISADNLNDAGTLPTSPRATTPVLSLSTDGSSMRFRNPSGFVPAPPNIRIQLDPLTGGTVISSDSGVPHHLGHRSRPRVTFIQPPAGFSATTGVSVSLTQAASQLPVYYGTALINSLVSSQAQAEECLKSCLAHQRSRKVDMQKANTSAKSRLEELRMDVNLMEQDLVKRRKHSIRSEAISDEALDALHKETRELQASVQAAMKELDLHRAMNAGKIAIGVSNLAIMDNKSNSQKFDGKDEGVGDMDQWSCSYCTFQNHVDLPLCELCEMPRVIDVDGWQLVYDISPSAFDSPNACQ